MIRKIPFDITFAPDPDQENYRLTVGVTDLVYPDGREFRTDTTQFGFVLSPPHTVLSRTIDGLNVDDIVPAGQQAKGAIEKIAFDMLNHGSETCLPQPYGIKLEDIVYIGWYGDPNDPQTRSGETTYESLKQYAAMTERLKLNQYEAMIEQSRS